MSPSFKPLLITGTTLLLAIVISALVFSTRADEPTPAEREKFKQLLGTLSAEDRQKIEDSLAAMTPSDRDQFIHRYALAADQAISTYHRKMPEKILMDLRYIDASIDQYAIETNKTSSFHPSFADLKNYLKAGTSLYNTGADLLGNSYGPFTVDSIPLVPAATFNALSDIADAAFWSPFK